MATRIIDARLILQGGGQDFDESGQAFGNLLRPADVGADAGLLRRRPAALSGDGGIRGRTRCCGGHCWV